MGNTVGEGGEWGAHLQGVLGWCMNSKDGHQDQNPGGNPLIQRMVLAQSFVEHSVVTGSNAALVPEVLGPEWPGIFFGDSVNPKNSWINQKRERGAPRDNIDVYAYQKDRSF